MPVRKLLEQTDVLVIVRVQIAVAASRSDALQGVDHNQSCCWMLRQKLLDLLFQPALECVSHDRKMQRRWRVLGQIKEPCLDALERIFEAEIQDFTLCHGKIPERLALRNAQAQPQRQPRFADLRRAREDVQALWNKLICQKVRRFVCSVLQIFCCDGFEFRHLLTSFPFAIDILCCMI